MISNTPMPGSIAAREPKATMLMDRIKQMDVVVNRLQLLRDRIVDGNVPRPSDDDKISVDPAPTLALVLNEGPERLQGMFNTATDIIAQIEQELF